MTDELRKLAIKAGMETSGHGEDQRGAPLWSAGWEDIVHLAALVEEQTIQRCAVRLTDALGSGSWYESIDKIRALPRLYAPPTPTQEGT